jgi:hypothetical protein
VPSSQQSVSNGLNDMAGLNGTVSYNLSQTDTLTASANYNSRSNDQRSSDHYLNGATSLLPASDYVRSTVRATATAKLRLGQPLRPQGRTAGRNAEDRPARLGLGKRQRQPVHQRLRHAGHARHPRQPAQPIQHPHRRLHRRLRASAVGRHLKAGYKIATNDNSSNTLTDIDPVTGTATVNNGRTNAYEPDETVMRCTAATRCA